MHGPWRVTVSFTENGLICLQLLRRKNKKGGTEEMILDLETRVLYQYEYNSETMYKWINVKIFFFFWGSTRPLNVDLSTD